jgi:hypothetical protein
MAHTLLLIIYHILDQQAPYTDLGPNFYTQHEDPKHHKNKLIARLKKLGYNITLQPPARPRREPSLPTRLRRVLPRAFRRPSFVSGPCTTPPLRSPQPPSQIINKPDDHPSPKATRST